MTLPLVLLVVLTWVTTFVTFTEAFLVSSFLHQQLIRNSPIVSPTRNAVVTLFQDIQCRDEEDSIKSTPIVANNVLYIMTLRYIYAISEGGK